MRIIPFFFFQSTLDATNSYIECNKGLENIYAKNSLTMVQSDIFKRMPIRKSLIRLQKVLGSMKISMESAIKKSLVPNILKQSYVFK